MIKIFLRNNGKYLESTYGDNVNENINIKIDIYIYVYIYINIRNISSEIHLIISNMIIFRNDYVHNDSFVTFDYHLHIYERFDMSRRNILLHITMRLFDVMKNSIIRLSWKGLSRTLLLHTIIECIEWRNRIC